MTSGATAIVFAAAAAWLVGYGGNDGVTAAGSLPSLSATIPGDVAPGANASDIDNFSWQSFVAVNWPANGNEKIGANGDNVAVWQFWKQDADVLVPDGQVPKPWTAPPTIPPYCTQKAPAGTRILTHYTKGGELGDFLTPGNGPLIDQNGEYVRFEILVNEAMYDFILTNKLYSKAGQAAYNPGGVVAFPSGQKGGAPGAIMLKVAWKILGPGDDPKRFHTALAYIYDPGPTPSCKLEQVGLVGLHISHKTTNAPQWIWSTFEHIDNAPLVGNMVPAHYNFNNGKDCESAGLCNVVPVGAWNPNSGVKTPVQVARLDDFTPSAKLQNDAYSQALAAVNPNSVFANYRLVGTQFPSDVTSKSAPSGVPIPRFLANTTMETYLQGQVPIVSSNCAGCHYQATMSDQRLSDFSFILARVSSP
ncbi:hypothetical protein JJB09_21520 [Rhizobium sp. KVB221]|uniref:Cytochrome c family protein n=1 Tax=Rhizobium setariae TaxID=2801340 RepID=A0A936YWF9_9HYPH|nr:hypothetical protein [Rhizobium setariae]MBL0374595.1 hypothetical protein [Rhizobium setariae]